MNTIALEDAQAGLADLIHGLAPGQVVTIIEDKRAVAILTPAPIEQQAASLALSPHWQGYPHPGSCEGLFVVPDDFKEPLNELREYME